VGGLLSKDVNPLVLLDCTASVKAFNGQKKASNKEMQMLATGS